MFEPDDIQLLNMLLCTSRTISIYLGTYKYNIYLEATLFPFKLFLLGILNLHLVPYGRLQERLVRLTLRTG